MKDELNTFHRFFVLAFSAIILPTCNDSRDRTEGTGRAFGECSPSSEIIGKGAASLGPSLYYTLCSAQQSTFDRIANNLEGSQVEAYWEISRFLTNYVKVIEREPTTRIARMADEELLKHINFTTSVPSLKQRWITARQRMIQRPGGSH